MAIKGKSKGKSAKAVTRGPKPAYVPVKKPLLARRGLWIGIASVLGVALVVGLAIGFLAQREQDEEEALAERMAESLGEYQGQLEPILAAIGEPVAPTGLASFPDLAAAIQELENDSEDTPADPDAIVTTAESTLEAATSALDAFEGLDELALIQGKGFSEEFVLYVINSKGNFVRSMRLYIQAAKLTRAAAEAGGAERAALLARARGVADVAAELATRANSDYVEAQVKAGLFESSGVPTLPVPSGPTG